MSKNIPICASRSSLKTWRTHVVSSDCAVVHLRKQSYSTATYYRYPDQEENDKKKEKKKQNEGEQSSRSHQSNQTYSSEHKETNVNKDRLRIVMNRPHNVELLNLTRILSLLAAPLVAFGAYQVIKYYLGNRVCIICGETIKENHIHFRNMHKQDVCVNCVRSAEKNRCFCCQKVISPNAKVKGIDYVDGRQVCSSCYSDAVLHTDVAQGILPDVMRTLQKAGNIEFPPNSQFSVHLVNRKQMEKYKNRSLSADPVGVTSVRNAGATLKSFFQFWKEKEVRWEGDMYILNGLSKTHYGAVVAHELGHAYLQSQSMNNLPSDVQEGLCELFAYLYLQQLDRQRFYSPAARIHSQLIKENNDPVYGEGFRRVWQEYERRGEDLKDFVESLKIAINEGKKWSSVGRVDSQPTYFFSALIKTEHK